jgi:RimJ/RimL family protein N-acetyltransferase
MEPFHINTPRLQIRPLTLADLADFHFYRSNPEVTKYQGFNVMTKEQAEQFIVENSTLTFGTRGKWVQYGIEHVESKRLIGDCAIKLDQSDDRMAQIGITLSPPEQQKGYAKEALRGILDFLFETNHIHRVTAIVDAENIASIHLMKSVGFRQEGHFIENIFFKGKWGSEMQFALLRREWEEIKK